MSPAQKKPMPAAKPAAAAQPATKIAGQTANKAASAAFSAAEATRSSAENFVRMSADTMKEFFSSGADEAAKAHDKAFAVSRESAENLSRVVEAYTRTLNDSVSLFRENADAAIEVCHITADVAKTISGEMVSYANSSFIENVEICKEACSCRNANDILEVQSKFFSSNMENLFSQSARMAEMCFQLFTEVSEPIQERVTEATERFSKSMAA